MAASKYDEAWWMETFGMVGANPALGRIGDVARERGIKEGHLRVALLRHRRRVGAGLPVRESAESEARPRVDFAVQLYGAHEAEIAAFMRRHGFSAKDVVRGLLAEWFVKMKSALEPDV